MLLISMPQVLSVTVHTPLREREAQTGSQLLNGCNRQYPNFNDQSQKLSIE